MKAKKQKKAMTKQRMDIQEETGLHISVQKKGSEFGMQCKITGDLADAFTCMAYALANFANDLHHEALPEMQPEAILALLRESAMAWMKEIRLRDGTTRH